MEGLAKLTGNKALLKNAQLGLKVSNKMYDLQVLFHYFINNEWIFESVFTDRVWAVMSREERLEFNFDPMIIDWSTCIQEFCFGIQRFYFRENRLSPESGFQQVLA